jgi:aminopeptidase-like protein
MMFELAGDLFPLPRSLTGDGVRRTLELIGRRVPLEVSEIPSGTQIYDWVVPPEWNVRAAWIADGSGRRVVDLADSSLHVVGYSEPVERRLTGRELDAHLHSLPDDPEATPYRTSYYERTWGFCLPHARRLELDPDATYEVRIDSTLDDTGSLTYGEATIPGRGEDELVISSYVCHPSLANDNVAGVVVAAALAETLKPRELRHTVRIVFAPSGIGTLAWLQRNESRLPRIRGGLVVACAGDPGSLSYKRSRRGDSLVDRAAEHVLGRRDGALRDFVPWGTDERQFNSPGFDLPVGTLTRTPNGEYEGYHTSRDNLSLITPEALEDTLDALVEIVRTIDGAATFTRTEPHGEPQLSRHGIDGRMTSAMLAGADSGNALFWLLNLADGTRDLLEIADRAGVPMLELAPLAAVLEKKGILAGT